MRVAVAAFMAALTFGAVPAPGQALPVQCKTAGTVDASIAFPANDPGDVPFARSMAPALLVAAQRNPPKKLACARGIVASAQGDYDIGGENDDEFPRVAMRRDGKPGPIVLLVESSAAPGKYALVVRSEAGPATSKFFYNGIPTDERLAVDVRLALADDKGIATFDPKQKIMRYGFVPAGGVPTPSPSGSGPQILVADSGDPDTLDTSNGMRHMPSGFACPQTFDGLAVLLMSIEPKEESLVCDYRAGTDLRYRADDPVRYQVTLLKARPGQSARDIFDQLVAGARQELKIKGDHTPPWATGPAAAPELVAFWDTESDGVQGVWVVEAGSWIVYLRAQYEPSAANDVEAGKVAQTLLALVKRQVK